MVKITPLVASLLVALVAAAPQAPSGTDLPLPSGTGGFGGHKPSGFPSGFPSGGFPSGTGFPGPKPTGGK